MTCDEAKAKPEPDETERVLAMLEGMALVCERDVVAAKRDEARSKNQREYEADMAGWSFDCSVWGSFLRLSWRRGAHTRNKYVLVGGAWLPAVGPQDFSTALYLPNIKSVTLVEGNAPDGSGEVSYHYRIDGGSSGYNDHRQRQLRFDSKFEVIPLYPQMPYGRELFREPAPADGKNQANNQAQGYWGGSQREQVLKYTTTDFPRPASDDRIEFTSLGITLFMPGGCGQAFYEAILLATGHDASPPLPARADEAISAP